MYTEFFNLRELPFRLSSDPSFYFLASGHEDAKHHLRAAFAEADGCLLLTGAAGVGKSTLLQALIEEIPPQYSLVHIRNPEVSVDEFYQAVLAQGDDRLPPATGAALRANFDTCLARLAAMRRTLALMIDNGELMSRELLEEVMRLPRRNGNGMRNLRILVASRSSIESILEGRGGGRQCRPALQVKLSPLTAAEARQYILHRLLVACDGAAGAIFDDEAFTEVHRYTGGVPRLINTLADAALMVSFNRNRERVSAIDVRTAVDQLKWVEFESRPDASGLHAIPRHAQAAEVVGESPPITGHARIEKDGVLLAEFDLPLGRISLGRSANNDVRIDSQFISRHHCQILSTSHYSVIEDMQSQNGLLAGNRRVSVHRLQHGEAIHLGDHVLKYSVVRRPPPAKLAAFRSVMRQQQPPSFGSTHVLAPAGSSPSDADVNGD